MNCASQRDRPVVNGPRLRWAWSVIAGFAMLWLASCEPSGTTFGPPSPEVTLTPTAALVPIASATARETATGDAGTLAIAPLMADEIGRFELLELEIQTDIATSNPFDLEELDIRVEFTTASGTRVNIGAFWYQEFDATGLRRVGEPGWRARFTPTETGVWTAVARIPARGLQS